jgi:ABC-type cobalamin/Fe3+-siderophores transport system ATPase subunit
VAKVRSRCCQKILHQHSTIRLLNQAEIDVDKLYVDVWLLDRPPRTFQVSESTLLKSFDLRNDRLGLGNRIKHDEGISVANERSRLLILGKPGAGKTTFLKHLAVGCSNGTFQPKLIPVFIELRRVRTMKWRLLDAISKELDLDQQQTHKLLECGRLLILLDGLDEVPISRFRRTVKNQIHELAQEIKYVDTRLILTCRTQIIEVIPQGFTPIEVAPFNKNQIEQFVKNWFRAGGLPEESVSQKWQAFLDATETNLALNEISFTPVLLSLMCLVLQDDGDLSTQTTMLYRKGIRLLLEKWNELKEIPEWEVGSEVYRQLEPEQKEALLVKIAAQKFENPENFVLFNQRELAEIVVSFLKLSNVREGLAVLKAIESQHGLLMERADELWSFSHLTFQEYLAAQLIAKGEDFRTLIKYISRASMREVLQHSFFSVSNQSTFLIRLKSTIDSLLEDDDCLQRILEAIHLKSIEACKSSRGRLSTRDDLLKLRAFYCAIAVNYIDDLSFDDLRQGGFDLRFHFQNLCDSNGSPDCIIDHKSWSLLYNAYSIVVQTPYVNSYSYQHIAELFLGDYTFLLNYPIAPDYRKALERVRAMLPASLRMPQQNQLDLDSLMRWSLQDGKAWVVQLRAAIVEHRKIRHSLDKNQSYMFDRYYELNKVFVELRDFQR